jgi:hypothetical protein
VHFLHSAINRLIFDVRAPAAPDIQESLLGGQMRRVVKPREFAELRLFE